MNFLLKNFKFYDKNSAGMADESNREPQEPKKPRRGAAESLEEWVITLEVVKKLEEDFR